MSASLDDEHILDLKKITLDNSLPVKRGVLPPHCTQQPKNSLYRFLDFRTLALSVYVLIR